MSAAGFGCGGGDEVPPLFPVTGTVTYNGSPVPGATVVFVPEAKQKSKGVVPVRPAGVADDEGNFVLMLTEKHAGAPEGKYKVAITAVEQFGDEDDSEARRPNAIPDKFGNPATSGLTAVVEDGDNVVNFDLKDLK
jgi:hypothetical protein